MSIQSGSGWRVATDSLRDVLRSLEHFRTAYLAIFVVICLQQLISLKVGANQEEADKWLLLAIFLSGTFLLMPVWIALIHYFVSGDASHRYVFGRAFRRLVVALIGIGFCLGTLLGIGLVFARVIALASQPVALTFLVMLGVAMVWIMLRLTTFWPSLMFDRPAPLLKSSFRETEGRVWFILRSLLSGTAVLLPVHILIMLVALALFYLGILDPGSADGRPASASSNLIISMLDGAIANSDHGLRSRAGGAHLSRDPGRKVLDRREH